MILFKDDWHIQKPLVHFDTTNQSAIKAAILLKKLGVENNKFFLALHQKELLGIDPHNLKDNSLELRLRIAHEARINPWYYFRELLKIKHIGNPSAPYEFNRFNLALMWCFFLNIDTYSVILRQIGKTTGCLGLDGWLLNVGTTYYDIAAISKGNQLLQEGVSRLKEMRASLPAFMVDNRSKDSDNKEGLYYDATHNKYQTFTARMDPINAEKLGRGFTTGKLNWDEFAWLANNFISFPVAIATTDAGRLQAKAAGLPTAMVIATTAGDPSIPEGAFALKIRNECGRFQEKYYDLQDRAAVETTLANLSVRKMFYITYNHLQLGKTDEWLMDTIKRSGASPDKVAREYLNQWYSSGISTAIAESTKREIMASLQDPCFTEHKYNILFNFYVPKERLLDINFLNTPFILANDCAENVGKDFTTLYMLHPKTLKPVMTCRCNESNLNKIASIVVDLLEQFPRSIYIPERNSVGGMLVDIVIDVLSSNGINPFTRIYNTVVNDAPNVADIEMDVNNITGAIKGKFGFRTTSGPKGRAMLYTTTFDQALILCKDKVKDAVLIDELCALVIKNRRITHPDGGNDDTVISWLLAIYFVLHARNIEVYGIDNKELFSIEESVLGSNRVLKTKEDLNSSVTAEEYAQIQNEIKQLEAKYELCDVKLLKENYRQQIHQLRNKIANVQPIESNIVTRQQLKDEIEKDSITINTDMYIQQGRFGHSRWTSII
jgi:hypothetical protein